MRDINKIKAVVIAGSKKVARGENARTLNPVMYYNSTNEATDSDTVMEEINDLTIPVLNNSAYVIEYHLVLQTESAFTAIYFDYTGPTDASITWDEAKPYPDHDTPDVDFYAQIRMIANTNSDAGNIVLRFRSFIPGEEVRVRVGSMAVVNKL